MEDESLYGEMIHRLKIYIEMAEQIFLWNKTVGII